MLVVLNNDGLMDAGMGDERCGVGGRRPLCDVALSECIDALQLDGRDCSPGNANSGVFDLSAAVFRCKN